ncbi:hypothetical protein PanWU01x14_158220 [Parasponia andersonii]|uniref:Uncharacterized protein n=1 Tax=Parasponia andersonii TaxID=3476 RepID=A0A2P5CEX3_PARAD|nr:hypothetical protein PanWU01x14_158220 [Parasponia andersonii]
MNMRGKFETGASSHQSRNNITDFSKTKASLGLNRGIKGIEWKSGNRFNRTWRRTPRTTFVPPSFFLKIKEF